MSGVLEAVMTTDGRVRSGGQSATSPLPIHFQRSAAIGAALVTCRVDTLGHAGTQPAVVVNTNRLC